jgi:hypothetical protein
LDGQLHELLEAWPIDEQREEDYLASGAYTRELLEEAEKQSLGIYQQEGFLACYPSLLRVQARERALLVDRKVSRDLRPSLLVKRLLTIQKQPPKFAPAAFLEVLLRAYDFHKAGRGVVLPLLDLYETLTLLPQARRDYTQQEFARDLYLLDGSGVRNTKDGTPFRLHPGATAAKNRSKLLIVVTREGVERTYYGIEFDAHGR